MTITRLVPLSPPWAIAVTNRGPAGIGATIEIDPVVTILEPGEEGTATNLGTATHVILKLELPKGSKGDVGDKPSITIGTVTTTGPGNVADAEIDGPAGGPYELNLTIPQGDTGNPGVNAYTYVGYATAADGTGYAATPDNSRNYIAVRTSNTPLTPVQADFAGLWKLYRGASGVNAYTYVGYATAADGTGYADTPSPLRDYIAFRTSTTPLTPVQSDFDGLWKYAKGPAGPMDPAVYDPTSKNADAFSMANMVESTTNKIFTNVERGILSTLKARGTINTLSVLQEIAWATGAKRFEWTLEADASLGLRVYNSGGTLVTIFTFDQNGYLTVPGLSLFDMNGTKLSIAVGTDLTANRFLTILMEDANTTVHIPAGRLLAEWKANAPVTVTGASCIFNNLECDDVMLSINGISHNAGSNFNFNLRYSTDNGATWSTTPVILASAAQPVGFYSGHIYITGLRSGFATIMHTLLKIGAAPFPGQIGPDNMQMYAAVTGARINALKIEPASAAFDAGTITLLTRG